MALEHLHEATTDAGGTRSFPLFRGVETGVGSSGAPLSESPSLGAPPLGAPSAAPPSAAPDAVAVYPRRKRAFDVVSASLALVVLLPLMTLIALISRIVDGPQVIFRQRRVGLGNEEFTLLKFRSITSDAQEAATRWSVQGDQRMSAWGRFLRRSSLDELPQLVNVVKGEMSLVGPRPERPHFVERFSRMYPHYSSRHRMPGGLTGLAQISGLRGDTCISERARMDNQYIDRWSLRRDLAIVVRTPLALMRGGE